MISREISMKQAKKAQVEYPNNLFFADAIIPLLIIFLNCDIL